MALNQVPLAGQTLSQTRDPISNNFTAIANGFAVDHEELVVPIAGNSGRHKKVTLTQHSNLAANRPAVTTNGFVLYDAIPDTAQDSRFPTTLATPEINVLKDGTNIIVPMTASKKDPSGWTYLPSGILLKWGTGSANRNTRTTISMDASSSIPLYSAVYYITAIQSFTSGTTDGNLNVAFSVGEISVAGSPTTFKVFPRANALPNTGSVNFYWYAVGLGPT